MSRMHTAMLILIGALSWYPICVRAQAQRPRPGPDVRGEIQIRMPDLVVTSFVPTGAAAIVNGAVELPVRVVIKNLGTGAAPVFMVGVEYTIPGAGGPVAVAFDVGGEASNWRPSTDATLSAGKSASFSGRLKFNPALHHKRVSLRALADSCAGDEFMEDYCRVRETNELNNRSGALWALLP